MARQGNYVSVPGGSANWASGISGSLSDLSKSLIRQGDEEEKAIRLDAAAEEDKRRFQENLNFRNKEAKLAEQDRAARRLLDQAADARAAATAERQQKTYEQTQTELDRNRNIRDILEGYDSKISFDEIKTYTPELAGKIERASGSKDISNVVSAAESLFKTDNPNFMPSRIDDYVSAVEKQRGEKFTPQKREEMAINLKNKLSPLYSFPEEYRGEFKEDLLNSLGVTALQQSNEEFISRAPRALTKEEAKTIHTNRLIKSGVPRAQAIQEANSIVDNNYQRKSYIDILNSRTKSAELQNEALKDQRKNIENYIDVQLDLVDKLGSGKSSYKSSGNPAKDITQLLKEGNVHSNVDDGEMTELVNRYSALVPKYGSDVAMAATLRSFKPSFWGDEIVPLAEAEQFALDIQKLRDTSSGSFSGSKDIKKQALANLNTALSKDLLEPLNYRGANMAAWEAGRWGDRAKAAVDGLLNR